MTLKDLSSNQTDPQQNRALFGHLIVVVPAQQTQRLDLLPEPLRFLLTYIQRERITEQQILPRTCSSFSLQDEAELREKRWEDGPEPLRTPAVRRLVLPGLSSCDHRSHSGRNMVDPTGTACRKGSRRAAACRLRALLHGEEVRSW